MLPNNQHQDSIDHDPEPGVREPSIIDLVAILSVPVLLASIHFLVPDSLKYTLAFSHDQFKLYTLFTGSYIHGGQSHLFNNILAYLLAAISTYWICIVANQRRWFRWTFVSFLIVLPILVSIASYTAFSTWYPGLSPVSRGFSGVAAGFAGFLLVSLAVFGQERYSTNVGILLGTCTLFVLFALIDYIYAGRIRLVTGGLVAAGILLEFGYYHYKEEITIDNLERRQLLINAGYVTYVWAVLIAMTLAMFPAEISQDGSTINIVAHAMGFLLGLGISVLTKAGERLWGSDRRERAVSKTPD